MLKIPDDVSYVLLNMLDKVNITFGATRRWVNRSELEIFYFDPLNFYTFITHE